MLKKNYQKVHKWNYLPLEKVGSCEEFFFRYFSLEAITLIRDLKH